MLNELGDFKVLKLGSGSRLSEDILSQALQLRYTIPYLGMPKILVKLGPRERSPGYAPIWLGELRLDGERNRCSKLNVEMGWIFSNSMPLTMLLTPQHVAIS